MASVEGHGGSLGAAFRNALAGLSTGHARGSYDRVGWSAQFKQLFGTDHGYKALGTAGLDVQARTLRGWLDGTTTPTPANRAKIADAYKHMHQGGLPSSVKNGTMAISGEVSASGHTRDRGNGQHKPMNIDLGTPASRWDRIEPALTDGTGDGDLEDLVVSDLIEKDLGDFSDLEFPGGAYTVGIGS